MITLSLDWREVLWWMQGGMAGSHVRWSVYEDMVNRVWPQCDEQTRRNLHYVMRRDLGYYWRPDGWNGYKHPITGEGEWKPEEEILDRTAWMYFRQVLARFDPDQQWAVTVGCATSQSLDDVLRFTPNATLITGPTAGEIRRFDAGKWPKGKPMTLTVRAYRWQDDYRIDWDRRIVPDIIQKAERLDIPDTGEM